MSASIKNNISLDIMDYVQAVEENVVANQMQQEKNKQNKNKNNLIQC